MKVLKMIVEPSRATYRDAFHDLLRRKYLGDDVDSVLFNLDYIYHLAENFEYYAAIYGRRRVLVEIFSILGRLPEHSRLEILADAYRYDRTVVDDLYEELLKFKRQMIEESAPVELVQMVNNIIASIGSKPEEVYRHIKHLVAMYRTWREMGESAVEYFRSTIGPAPQGGASDVELAKVVEFVLYNTKNGRRVSSTDIKRFIGDPRAANQILNEAKKRGLIEYNAAVRSFVVTKKGLEFIGRAAEFDPDEIVQGLKA